jgi:hypothetical protein
MTKSRNPVILNTPGGVSQNYLLSVMVMVACLADSSILKIEVHLKYWELLLNYMLSHPTIHCSSYHWVLCGHQTGPAPPCWSCCSNISLDCINPIIAKTAVSKVIITLISTLYTCEGKERYVVFAPHPLTVTLSHLSTYIDYTDTKEWLNHNWNVILCVAACEWDWNLHLQKCFLKKSVLLFSLPTGLVQVPPLSPHNTGTSDHFPCHPII